MSSDGLLDQLAGALADIFRPLQGSFASPTAFETLLRQHGWQPPPAQKYFTALSAALKAPGDVDAAVNALDALLADGDISAADAGAALSAAVKLLDDFRKLGRPATAPLPSPFDRDDFWSTFFGTSWPACSPRTWSRRSLACLRRSISSASSTRRW
jgi:hypothetical protein